MAHYKFLTLVYYPWYYVCKGKSINDVTITGKYEQLRSDASVLFPVKTTLFIKK